MRRGDGRSRVRRLLVTLAADALLTLACGDEGTSPPRVDRDAVRGTEPPGNDFFFDPARYVGREVTVTGYVSDVLTGVAFRMGGDKFEGLGIPVVSNGDLSTLDDRDLVQVTGTVQWFTTETFARDLGVRLDPVAFNEFEGGVAVAASRVTINGIRSSTP